MSKGGLPSLLLLTLRRCVKIGYQLKAGQFKAVRGELVEP